MGLLICHSGAPRNFLGRCGATMPSKEKRDATLQHKSDLARESESVSLSGADGRVADVYRRRYIRSIFILNFSIACFKGFLICCHLHN